MKMTIHSDTKRTIYTVSQINRKIKMMLETEFPSIWLEGEISNFKHHSSGHMYFTVKDDRSQMSAVFFSRNNQLLKFDLKDGMQVLLYGKISAYEPRGQYQIYVERVEPKGVGSLQLAFEKLKAKLLEEGLFDEECKKPIPKYPRRVGVITSPTGAAIQDILNVMGRRFAGTPVVLFPVRVQGEEAAGEIADAIEVMNDYGEMDVLIVGRGGGSLEDLWAFNEEIVARAIFKSKIPVISAVGHEVDWTISDMVADLRAPTPSAAAELVVANQQMLVDRVSELSMRMRQSVELTVDSARQRVETALESYAFRQPTILIEQHQQRLDDQSRYLGTYVKNQLQLQRHLFEGVSGKLEALSPLKILGRGYSITQTKDRRVIKKISQVKKDDVVITRLQDGNIISKVDKTEKV